MIYEKHLECIFNKFRLYFLKYKLNYTTKRFKNQSLLKFFMQYNLKIMPKGDRSTQKDGKSTNGMGQTDF